MKSKLGKAELVMAYEQRKSGRHAIYIAKDFGVSAEYLKRRIRKCERIGLGWLQ